MAEICQSTRTIYSFRFAASNKILHLTPKQLDYFPYLSVFVVQEHNFSSVKNDNSEYILNYPICYNWFMPIFLSITKKRPHLLFSELPQKANTFRMLQLYDYLCVKPLSLPLLKDVKLIQTNLLNQNNKDKRIQYYRANLGGTRNMAIRFVIGLIKTEYDLNDLETLNSIFLLVMIIFSNAEVFHARFRYHTWIIVKKFCYSLFSDSQQNQFPTSEEFKRNYQIDCTIYLNNDDQSLPKKFTNPFAWKGYYLPKEKSNGFRSRHLFFWPTRFWKSLNYCHDIQVSFRNDDYYDYPSIYLSDVFNSVNEISDMNELGKEEEVFDVHQWIEKQKQLEKSQLNRSGHFNRLTKSPTVDKFKHRSSPKAQKYR